MIGCHFSIVNATLESVYKLIEFLSSKYSFSKLTFEVLYIYIYIKLVVYVCRRINLTLKSFVFAERSPRAETSEMHAVSREMSSSQNPKRRLSWFDRPNHERLFSVVLERCGWTFEITLAIAPKRENYGKYNDDSLRYDRTTYGYRDSVDFSLYRYKQYRCKSCVYQDARGFLNERRASKLPCAWRLSLPRYNWHDTRNCLLSRPNRGTMKRNVRNAGTTERRMYTWIAFQRNFRCAFNHLTSRSTWTKGVLLGSMSLKSQVRWTLVSYHTFILYHLISRSLLTLERF